LHAFQSSTNKSEVKVAAIDAVKRQYEEKFKALEKAKADALEMAAQEDEERETKKDCKD
jgi:hypothetical protein